MTKEQWLENIKSDNPDYSGLLKLKDSELVVYLMDQLHKEYSSDQVYDKDAVLLRLHNHLMEHRVKDLK